MRHPSDDDLQEYLDKGPVGSFENIEKHLESCPACKENLARYKSLIVALANDPDISLSTHFEKDVLQRLQNESAQKSSSPFAKIMIILGAIVSVVGLSIFVDMKPFLKLLYQPLLDFWGRITSTSAVAHLGSDFGAGYTLILSAILIFMLVALIDRFAFRRT